jgi:hypothetical protein
VTDDVDDQVGKRASKRGSEGRRGIKYERTMDDNGV